MAFRLWSAEFRNGMRIPVERTALGSSSNPRLGWAEVPLETRELALLCEDPDAPFPKSFVHWIVYGMDPDVKSIPSAIPKDKHLSLPLECKQGRNSMGLVGYTGPNPPFWHRREHRYIFRLFALRETLTLAAGAGRGEFLDAIEGNVVAEAQLTGKYKKTPPQKVSAAIFWTALAGGAALVFGRMTSERRGQRRNHPEERSDEISRAG
ncbi:MAG: YbhB/YbcL family Raf kinase inhibitor-like protein [Methylotenera sp.]|nr:YbhB/YbcL family Raf kinase inhibitor-like protein [Oligoflexia bacterium]